ncbi:hypothetical protein G3I32_32435 [Streptomyces coelicoflavus]|uniref:Uncharacterized protein n=1 Tax=Streptomyces coelicoflavus TaxID=285562 RepID=A0A7K3PU48_9ACTN|nr:hypothetical protein [Streptomyces coelicoflavus]
MATEDDYTAQPFVPRRGGLPTLRETAACGPWLAAELDRVEPELIVVLGTGDWWRT